MTANIAGLGVPIPKNDSECEALLHTSIYNYFMSKGQTDVASAIRKSGIPVDQHKLKKDASNSLPNGVDDGADGDNKDDVKRALPGDISLLDYWYIFWDMWRASKTQKPENSHSHQYLMQQHRARMAQQPMMPQQMIYQNGLVRGPNGTTLARNAMNNNGRAASLNSQFNRPGQQLMGQHPMTRDGSDLGMNGQQQPGSPMSTDNTRSPKRQRLEGQFNGQQMNGPMRGGPLPNGAIGNQQAMMMQAGFDQKTLSPASMSGLMQSKQGQQQAYAASLAENQRTAMNFHSQFAPNAMPISATMPDYDMSMVAGGQLRNGPNTSNGGALADYQMQLMLLEQQNKKRLMMARQEQDVHGGPNGGGAMLGGPGAFQSGTSPHGRGPSPSNDTKRNTPKAIQGSPMLNDGMPPNRSSPAPGFDPTQMNIAMGGQFPMMGGNAQMGRPPSSHPMGQQVLRNGQGMPQWPGPQLQGQVLSQAPGNQNSQPEGNQPVQATNQQRGAGTGAMPPPSAPPGGNKSQSSPTVQTGQPPTPSQPNKPAPNKRKDTNDSSKKKKPTKKGTTAANATPNPENERTPPPPATPVNPNAASIKGQPDQAPDQHAQAQQQQGPGNMPQQQPPAPPPHQQHQVQQPQNNQQIGLMEANPMGEPFGSTAMFDQDLFGSTMIEDTSTILDGFDFDSFINEPGIGGWDNDFNTMPGEGLESGP